MSTQGLPPSSRRQSSTSIPKRGPSLSRKKPPSENGSTAGVRKSSSLSASRLSVSGERTVKRLRLTKALTIPEGTTVLDACRRMATRRVDAALLTDSSALLCGIITDKDVVLRVIAEGLKPEETAVSKVMTRNPLFVLSDTLAVDALQKMVQGKFRHLPVVENGEVIALLDITKCLYDAIARMERAAEKGEAIAAAVQGVEQEWGNAVSGHLNFIDMLRDKMFRPSLGSILQESSKVATVLPSDSVYTATKKMRDLRTSSAIVTTNNKPQGILTCKDVLMRVVSQNLSPDSTPVERVMTPNPEFATTETTIVDALHTMHDGKFLHLPVVDKEGGIVACLDVLHLTHATFAMMGNGEGNADPKSTMFQKFWDSAFSMAPAEDEDDKQSEVSLTRSSIDNTTPEHLKYPTLGLGSTFAFKVKDSKGRVHRFNSGTESLTELVSAIVQRVGDEWHVGKSHLLYEDDEGDRVVLATDSDLVAAISHARSLGWKALKLFVGAPKETLPLPLPSEEIPISKSRDIQLDMQMNKQQAWGSSAYTAAVAGAAVVVGISMLMILKRTD